MQKWLSFFAEDSRPNLASGVYFQKVEAYGGLPKIIPLEKQVRLLQIICIVDHDVARWLFYLYALLTVVAYIIAFASNWLVFRIVCRSRDKHRLNPPSSSSYPSRAESQRPCSAVRNSASCSSHTGSSFRPSSLSGIGKSKPKHALFQVPAFLTLSSNLLIIKPITNENVIDITQLWLASSPMLDAFITILVIKQYR